VGNAIPYISISIIAIKLYQRGLNQCKVVKLRLSLIALSLVEYLVSNTTPHLHVVRLSASTVSCFATTALRSLFYLFTKWRSFGIRLTRICPKDGYFFRHKRLCLSKTADNTLFSTFKLLFYFLKSIDKMVIFCYNVSLLGNSSVGRQTYSSYYLPPFFKHDFILQH
jgi:hypothetical protein